MSAVKEKTERTKQDSGIQKLAIVEKRRLEIERRD